MTARRRLINAALSLPLGWGVLGCTGLEPAPVGDDFYPRAARTAEPSAPPTGQNGATPIRQASHTDGDAPAADDSSAAEPPGPPAVGETTAAPCDPSAVEIDLTQALAMAGGRNPRIASAAARYREAYARFAAARVLWLPSINAGMSYHHHDGNLQASSGRIEDVSRSTLQAGLGVLAVGAGTAVVPGVVARFDTADAWFQPRIEERAASARRAAITTEANDVLLETALAYVRMLREAQQLRIAEEAFANAGRLAGLTRAFAESGQGSQADADRADAERALRENDVERSRERVQVAALRLIELLRLDAGVQLRPRETSLIPIDLVPPGLPPGELVATGLANRPELAEASELVGEAVACYRREELSPWLPSVWLGVSESSFAGGLGGTIDQTRGRFDFDAAVYWELRNLGFGERAARDQTRARVDAARAEQVRTMDRVAREVGEAAAQVRSRRPRIATAEAGVRAAVAAVERDFDRIQEGEGLPIEALQSIRALQESRTEYLRAIAEYDEAQFRLQRAMGWPAG